VRVQGVDESQYRGTCYRACGFAAVGLTAGYGRSSRDYYLEHGQPKQFYLRELRPRAMNLLWQGRLRVTTAAVLELLKHFQSESR
jgi:hypothetical protein